MTSAWADLQRLVRWLRRLPRSRQRLLAVVTVVSAAMVAVAPWAVADSGGNPALAFVQLTDTYQVSVWNYGPLFRSGSGVLGSLYEGVASVLWGQYQSTIAVGIWTVDQVLSLSWVSMLADPLVGIERGLRQVIQNVGVVGALTAVAVLYAGWLWARGRVASAVWEAVIPVVVGVLLVTVLAHPLRSLVAPGGPIQQTQALTRDIAGMLGTDLVGGKEQRPAALLATVFVRRNHQVTTFGKVLDGGPCEAVYTEAISQPADKRSAALERGIAKCDPSAAEYAKEISLSSILAELTYMPTAVLVLLLCLVVACGVVLSLLGALYAGLKLSVTAVVGILPGPGRSSLAGALAEVVTGLLGFVFAHLFLTIATAIIAQVFGRATGDSYGLPYMAGMMALLIALFVFVRFYLRLGSARDALSRMLLWRPDGPAAAPKSAPSLLDRGRQAISTAHDLTMMRRPGPSTRLPAAAAANRPLAADGPTRAEMRRSTRQTRQQRLQKVVSAGKVAARLAVTAASGGSALPLAAVGGGKGAGQLAGYMTRAAARRVRADAEPVRVAAGYLAQAGADKARAGARAGVRRARAGAQAVGFWARSLASGANREATAAAPERARGPRPVVVPSPVSVLSRRSGSGQPASLVTIPIETGRVASSSEAGQVASSSEAGQASRRPRRKAPTS